MNHIFNVAWNASLSFVSDNPMAYPYIICLTAALIAFIATCFYSARTKSLLKLIKGDVPKLNESASVRAFEDQRSSLRDKADSAGFTAWFAVFVCLVTLVWTYRADADGQYIVLVIGTVLLLTSLMEFVFGGMRYDTQIDRAVAGRPELACIEYLSHLPAKNPAENPKDKLCWGSLDDFVSVFEIGKSAAQMGTIAPLESSEAQALSDAQWRATHEELPAVGELVLIIWRDGKKDKIKMLVSKVASIEDAPPDSLLANPGKVLIKAACEQFCGGRMAHFCGTPSDKIERGWLATADRAHVLLASLRWLDQNQREFCYQLINPGKSYPAIADWTTGQ